MSKNGKQAFALSSHLLTTVDVGPESIKLQIIKHPMEDSAHVWRFKCIQLVNTSFYFVVESGPTNLQATSMLAK